MIKSNGRLWITIICMIIGFMLVMQIKSIGNLGGLVTTQRADEMLVEINQMERENKRLEDRIQELENNIQVFESEASSNNEVVESILNEIDTARAQAGYTELIGSGIVITLDYKDDDGFDPFTFNSELLLLLVNELNAAGAEAMSINGERIINTSEIRLAGNHININGKKTTYPFVFNVIGQTDTLSSAINIRGGIVDLMEINYIDVSVEGGQDIMVPKYNGTLNFYYAKPIQ